MSKVKNTLERIIEINNALVGLVTDPTKKDLVNSLQKESRLLAEELNEMFGLVE